MVKLLGALDQQEQLYNVAQTCSLVAAEAAGTQTQGASGASIGFSQSLCKAGWCGDCAVYRQLGMDGAQGCINCLTFLQ